MTNQTTRLGRIASATVIFSHVFMAGILAGTFTLSRTADTYTLLADQAILSDILADIDRQEPAALRFFGDYGQTVSATYRDVSLDNLLYRLGVSYVLTYEADEYGEYHLSDAMMLDSDGMGVDAITAAKIRALIRDLRDDDIPFNAHHAFYALLEKRCEAIPFLEQALYDTDFQCRHAAAYLLRVCGECEGFTVSDRLIEVSFEGLDHDYDMKDLAEFIWLDDGYQMLQDTGIYTRVRSRILSNLSITNGRVRLYSSLLAAQHRETTYIPQLVRIMAPHLADNDIPDDAAACAHSLYQLGPEVLPHLQPYRTSSDIQQAELAELICKALETGESPKFNPVMYYGYTKNPVASVPWTSMSAWSNDQFPDSNGQYHNLKQPRQTAADIYGTSLNKNFGCVIYDDAPKLEIIPVKGAYYEGEYDPRNSNLPEPPFPYTVKPGDTIHSICIKFSAVLKIVIELNPQLPQDLNVEPGMKMLIPWQ